MKESHWIGKKEKKITNIEVYNWEGFIDGITITLQRTLKKSAKGDENASQKYKTMIYRVL